MARPIDTDDIAAATFLVLVIAAVGGMWWCFTDGL